MANAALCRCISNDLPFKKYIDPNIPEAKEEKQPPLDDEQVAGESESDDQSQSESEEDEDDDQFSEEDDQEGDGDFVDTDEWPILSSSTSVSSSSFDSLIVSLLLYFGFGFKAVLYDTILPSSRSFSFIF